MHTLLRRLIPLPPNQQQAPSGLTSRCALASSSASCSSCARSSSACTCCRSLAIWDLAVALVLCRATGDGRARTRVSQGQATTYVYYSVV